MLDRIKARIAVFVFLAAGLCASQIAFADANVITVKIFGNGEVVKAVLPCECGAGGIPRPEADLSEDCKVDMADFALFGRNWLLLGTDVAGNFNHDSQVDANDLMTFSSQWLDDTWPSDCNDPTRQTYRIGEQVELTAVPADGNTVFVDWTGDADSVANPLLFTVQKNISDINAMFILAEWVDHFDGSEPNWAAWTFINPLPLGDSSVRIAGGALDINVPGGNNHDADAPITAPHFMTHMYDMNFTIEAKFNSEPNQTYQMQGLLVKSDPNNFIRFDVSCYNSSAMLYSARFVNGQKQKEPPPFQKILGTGSPHYLRIQRQKATDLWILEYSYNGTDWFTDPGLSFVHKMAVSSVGIFAGNFGTASNNAPAFTGVVDYFWRRLAPLDPPASNQYSVTVDAMGQGIATKVPDEPYYPVDANVQLSAAPSGSASFIGWRGDVPSNENPITVQVSGNKAVTAVFAVPDSNSAINVWYGDHQVFGQNGNPQQWINILGSVDANITTSLMYSLNGGTLRSLSMGPQQSARLIGAGDFNVELNRNELLANNTLRIIAVHADGAAVAKTITCDYTTTGVASLPYDVNWSTVTAISDAAQIVDGRWKVDANGVSTDGQGYDRLIAIGNMNSWQDYEVTVPVTVYKSYYSNGQAGNKPAIGFGMRWLGHSKIANEQPSAGFLPVGAYGLFRIFDVNSGQGAYRIYNSSYIVPANCEVAGALTPGVTYIFKMKVQTFLDGSHYYFKVWDKNQSEPLEWLMEMVESSEPASGSILLIAHHVDATFGNVTVRPLP